MEAVCNGAYFKANIIPSLDLSWSQCSVYKLLRDKYYTSPLHFKMHSLQYKISPISSYSSSSMWPSRQSISAFCLFQHFKADNPILQFSMTFWNCILLRSRFLILWRDCHLATSHLEDVCFAILMHRYTQQHVILACCRGNSVLESFAYRLHLLQAAVCSSFIPLFNSSIQLHINLWWLSYLRLSARRGPRALYL